MRLAKYLIGAIALALPIAANAALCPTGYTYAKRFVIPKSSVNSTLTDFPVPLFFNGITPAQNGGIATATSFVLADLKASGSGGKILSSGFDIVACDAFSGGNLLPFERAFYDGTTGKLEMYVDRTVSSSADTSIYLFYGKAGDTDHQNVSGTWVNFIEVCHVSNGTALAVGCSVSSGTEVNHGATATSGQIDGAAAFVGTSSQYIDLGNPANAGTSVTAEAWVFPTANMTFGRAVDNLAACGTCNGYALFLGQSGTNTTPEFITANAGVLKEAFATPVLPLSSWSYMVGTGSAASTNLYINGGNLRATTTGQNVGTSAQNLSIGRWGGGTAFWTGSVDEVRVSNVLRSTDWMTANYNAILYNSSFSLMVDANKPASMSSGAYCVPLTINHSLIPNTDQTNYPLFVRGTYAWMADTANGGFAVVSNSGKDIRFYSDTGCRTALSFQRVFWVNTTGDSSWRVKIPTLSHTVDTTIYVRIGNAADTTDLSTTWMGSAGFITAWQGGQPNTVTTTESGSSTLGSFSCGAGVTGAQTPVGGGFFFPTGGTDTQTCGNGPSTLGDKLSNYGYPVGGAAGHVRYWFRNVSTTSAGGTNNDVTPAAYGKANGTGQRGLEAEYRTCQLDGLGELQFSTPGTGIVGTSGSCGANVSTPSVIMDLAWHVFDFDQPTNGATYSQAAVYFDGVKITTPIYWAGTSTSVVNTADGTCCTSQSEIRMGRMAAHGAGWFSGYVAQFEITNASESADLVQTRYNNELSPGSFYTFGTAQTFTATTTQPVVGFIM